MTARPEFAPAPRPPLPLSTMFACLARDTSEMRACSYRAESSTRAYVRCSDRCWRWLFLPLRPPVAEDSQP